MAGKKGPAAESYVAFSLLTQGYTPYYWAKGQSSELDFVVQGHSGSIIPIEVKSADNVRAKSLDRFRKADSIDISVRISSKNIGFNNGIFSLPHYAVFCLKDIDENLLEDLK